MRTMLVAGIGNIFFGDDGFGVEVVNRLATGSLPDNVTVRDFGIRGLHLAYEILEGKYATTILLDAAPRGGTPGSLYLIEPDMHKLPAPTADAHAMDPATVLARLRALGGAAGKVLIVGCEPASIEEGVGLSAPVAESVDEAVRMVREIIEREQSGRL